VYPQTGFWVDPDLASGRAAEFATGDLVKAFFFVEEVDEGSRRSQVVSSEAKMGRLTEVKENTTLVVRFDDGSQQEIPRGMVASSPLPAYRCPVGACQGGENFSCAEGHHGRVCGLCNETRDEGGAFYSWSGSSCVKCQDGNLGDVTAVVVGLAIVLPVLWFYIAWKPLVGCTITGTGLLELVTFRCLDKSTMVVRLLDNASAAIDMAQVLLMAVLPFSKIVISYFQVVSTFITTFQIEWPDEIFDFLQNMDIFNFDFLSLPETACVASDWDYPTRVMAKTGMPLAVLALLAIPSCVAWRMVSTGSRVTRERFEKTFSAFSWWGLFLFFVVYPSASVSVLNTFSCLDLGRSGKWLMSDVQVPCPESGEFVYVFSVIGVILYPLGVPAGMLGMLYYYEVPKMARQKKKAAELRALIATFRQEVVEGQEEGITGRELERWWDGPGGWKGDPVEALGGEAQLKALLRHAFHDPTAVDSDTTFRTLLTEKLTLDNEEARETLRSRGRTPSTRRLSKSKSILNKSKSVNKVANDQAMASVAEQDGADGLDELSLVSLRRQVARLAEKVVSKGVLGWNGEFGEVESLAVLRAGFLFELYEVEYWWFELFEMMRKLIMTSVLVFVTAGGLAQILVGLIVIFASFVVTFGLKPYVSPNLDRCQLFSLGTQFVMLQYGLVLHLDGTSETSQVEKALVNFVMMAFNATIFILPPLSVLVENAPNIKDQVRHWRDVRRDMTEERNTALPGLQGLTRNPSAKTPGSPKHRPSCEEPGSLTTESIVVEHQSSSGPLAPLEVSPLGVGLERWPGVSSYQRDARSNALSDAPSGAGASLRGGVRSGATEPLPESAHVGSSKNLKDLKGTLETTSGAGR